MAYLKQKNHTKEQINEYKMAEKEIYEKFSNLSKEELNARNKNVCVKKVVMTAIIKHCRGEKKV